MTSEDKALFLRRYSSRIAGTNSYWPIDKWFAIYTNEGEAAFLDLLEDEENYAAFCGRYYEILREAYNICSAGMHDYYVKYKEKFESDRELFENELRKDRRLAKLMSYYL